MLRPKKSKFLKSFKGKIYGIASKGFTIAFGNYGLKSIERGRIRDNQIESARKAINGNLKRSGKLWIRIFPSVPITKKPIEVRMGKGKGNVEYYVCKVKPGRILFELSNVTEKQAFVAFSMASYKIPLKTKFVKYEN